MIRVVLGIGLFSCLSLITMNTLTPRDAVAAEGPTASVNLSTDTKESHFFATFSADALSLNSSTGSVLGTGLSGELGLVLSPKFRLGLTATEAFAISGGFSALYSAVQIGLEYALTGSFRSSETSYAVDNQNLVLVHEIYPGGLRAQAFFSQFFLDGAKNIVSLSGGGVGAAYEWPTFSNMNPGVQARVDLISSSQVSLQNWMISFTYTIHY